MLYCQCSLKDVMKLIIKYCGLNNDFSTNYLSLTKRITPLATQKSSTLIYHLVTTIVHSGLVKFTGEKSYHPYFSDSHLHDQVFVKLAIDRMLHHIVNFPEHILILIESDNCTSQYKSVQHFADMQSLADEYNTVIIQSYGISADGKGEVDNVEGVAKVTIRQAITAGLHFPNSHEMVEFLTTKFCNHKSPTYNFKEISVEELELQRENARRKVFPTISGSSRLQIMVFKHHETEQHHAYGSCDLLKSYP